MSFQALTPDELKAFRKGLGSISQAALADRLGVSTRTVEEWETGRREPPAMLRLALTALRHALPPYELTGVIGLPDRTFRAWAGGNPLVHRDGNPVYLSDEEAWQAVEVARPGSRERDTIMKREEATMSAGLWEALEQVKEGKAGVRHAIATVLDLALSGNRSDLLKILQSFAEDGEQRERKGRAPKQGAPLPKRGIRLV